MSGHHSLTSSILDTVAGPLLHLVFLVSVFDIHFKSPIVSSPTPAPPPSYPAPASRLVLLVADGLRAESFYQPGAAPFLHRVGREGVMGLSHTRVPTESRPGHVALLAGLYEDPSAITRGWTENPVEFDSVLNRSSHSWSWGSPDILPMFGRGAGQGQVDMEMYDAEFENFASKDSSSLDLWVFERVREFLVRSQLNTRLGDLVRKEGSMFFLHLLGCDTNGHVQKPHSKQYKENIRVVDRGVEGLVGELREFFGDNRTVFVFTADHGMTDWGSHGTGMDQETVTPLVVWGAGVRWQGKRKKRVDPSLAKYPVLNKGAQVVTQVRQTDLAPLMSSLLARTIPQHSAGRLPVSLLSLNSSDSAAAMRSQVEQLMGQFLALRTRHQEVYLPSIFYAEFPGLAGTRIQETKDQIHRLEVAGDWDEALKVSEQLLDTVEEGVEYYQRYQAETLSLLVQLAYFGCIALNLLGLMARGQSNKTSLSPKARLAVGLISACLVTCHLCQRLPLHWLLYYLAPLYTWTRVMYLLMARKSFLPSIDAKNIPTIVAVIITLAIISGGFTDRRILSLGMLLLPLLLSRSPKLLLHSPLLLFLSTLMAVFPSLPVIDGRDPSPFTVLASGFMVTLVTSLTKSLSPVTPLPLLASLCVVASGQVEGLPFLLQVTAWLLFLLPLPLAILTTPPGHLEDRRHLALGLSLVTLHTLLSLSWEALLLPLLLLLLHSWVSSEQETARVKKKEGVQETFRNDREHHLQQADVLRILAFFFLNFYSFFATGNIASLNSFDPSSIRCFVAVFSPFLMGSLLLLKVLLPFLLLSIHLVPVLQARRLDWGPRRSAMSHTLQLFTDVLGLVFFRQVTHTGSWLQIGTSLSHFVIVEGTSLAIAVLLWAARLLLSC